MTLRAEKTRFWIALGFLTRVPIPGATPFSQAHLDRCARYFPLVGLLLGLVLAAITWIIAQLWSPTIAALLSTVLSIRLTGAFHEDGLADSCDGLGGGWTAQQSLSIMKDSRLGTYGAVALVLGLGLKIACLREVLASGSGTWVLIVAHSFSRLAPLALMASLPYVGDQPGSKSKPLARTPQSLDLAVASLFGFAPLALCDTWSAVVWILLTSLVVVWMWRRLVQKKLGGYTGDTLGAVQQLVELTVYLMWVGRWTSI